MTDLCKDDELMVAKQGMLTKSNSLLLQCKCGDWVRPGFTVVTALQSRQGRPVNYLGWKYLQLLVSCERQEAAEWSPKTPGLTAQDSAAHQETDHQKS